MGVLTKFSTTATAGNFLVYKVGHCSLILLVKTKMHININRTHDG